MLQLVETPLFDNTTYLILLLQILKGVVILSSPVALLCCVLMKMLEPRPDGHSGALRHYWQAGLSPGPLLIMDSI
jgi:hypothetical protein